MADKTFAFRVPKELADWLEAQAAKEERRLSDWLRRHFTAVRERAGKRRGKR